MVIAQRIGAVHLRSTPLSNRARSRRRLGLVVALIAGALLSTVAPALAAGTGVVSVLTPTSGEQVGEELTLTAAAPEGMSVSYVITKPGGTRVTAGTAGTAPFTVDWQAPDVGSYTVTAYACAGGKVVPSCTGGTSDPISFTVIRMAPTIDSVTGTFSPNGDGVADTATVGYTLDEDSTPFLAVTDTAGNLLFVRKIADSQLAGQHRYAWDGKSDTGSRLSNGRYLVSIATVRDLTDSREFGVSDLLATTVDLTGPTLTHTHADGSLFIVPDGYRDSVRLLTTTSRAAALTFTIATTSGHKLRQLTTRTGGSGTAGVTWNGKNTAGRRVSPGDYTFTVIGTDTWGVKGKASAPLRVDGRHLVERSASRTLSPTGTQVDTLADDCNFVFDNFESSNPGSLALDSEGGCMNLVSPNVAATENAWTLPNAAGYGEVQVSVTGDGLNGSRALFELTDPSFLDGRGAVLTTAGRGTTSTKPVDASKLGGRRVHWVLAAEDGDEYVAYTFTVHWTYWKLVN